MLDKSNLNTILIPRFGTKRYSKIVRDDVQQMIFDLIPKCLKRYTMQHVLKTFGMVIKWQCRNDKVVYNADLTADLQYPLINPDEDKGRKGRALTVDEVKALLEALPPAFTHPNNDANWVADWLSTGQAMDVTTQRK